MDFDVELKSKKYGTLEAKGTITAKPTMTAKKDFMKLKSIDINKATSISPNVKKLYKRQK